LPGRVPLYGELALLDTAAAALAAGDGRRTLALLDAYTREYPRPRLAPEAEVLRIDALAQTGHQALAAKAAETFLKRHPDSVFAARVRRYVGE
jgi:outer membrane protein assembly factor BamD (BamD/ComL family)